MYFGCSGGAVSGICCDKTVNSPDHLAVVVDRLLAVIKLEPKNFADLLQTWEEVIPQRIVLDENSTTFVASMTANWPFTVSCFTEEQAKGLVDSLGLESTMQRQAALVRTGKRKEVSTQSTNQPQDALFD